MGAIRKRKTTRKQFQHDLIKLWVDKRGNQMDTLCKRMVKDEIDVDDFGTPIYQKMTLYYFKDVHCATWLNGKGWEFEVTQEIIDRENGFLDGIIVIENKRDEVLAELKTNQSNGFDDDSE